MRNLFRFVVVAVAFTMQMTRPCVGLKWSPAPTDSLQLTSSFSVTSTTQIPGKALKPGSYRIRLLDHLADRVILRIEDASGKPEGIFVGVPNASLANGNASGPVPWGNGPHKTDTLRGYAFPGGAFEFVYPKEEAVAIAKVNSEKVLAIDPASEGRPKNSKDLSDEDRQMVTLWMLAATRVGPQNASQPAIQAQRYEAPAPLTQVAQNDQSVLPAKPVTMSSTAASTAISGASSRPRARQAPTPRRTTQLAALPHTASDLPLVMMVGLLSLGASGVVRRIRATLPKGAVMPRSL